MGDEPVDDGSFGKKRDPYLPWRRPGSSLAGHGGEPEPGDKVRIIAGRHRGSTGVLNSIVTTPTPGGESVIVAYVKRPRAGITPVFSHEIERA